MVSKAMHVKQGDLCGGRADVHARCAEESGRAGVRAPIVASKRRNGRGAKGAQEGGCREARGEAPVRVPEGWSARPEPPAGRLDLTGADPHEDDIRPMPPEDMSGRLLRLELATLDRGQVSGSFFRIAVNHRPESRVREIRTHGSAGGGTGINRSSLPRSGFADADGVMAAERAIRTMAFEPATAGLRHGAPFGKEHTWRRCG